jgi:uncharacterized DUF497 family protein
LLNSHDQGLTIDDLVEIRKQSALVSEEAEEPEPKKRTVTIADLTEALGLIEKASKCLRTWIGSSNG